MPRRRLLPFIALLLSPLGAWAADPPTVGSLPHLQSLERIDAPADKGATGLFGEWIGNTTLKTNQSHMQNPFERLKDVRPDSHVPSTTGILSSTSLFKNQVTAESEFARSASGGDVSVRRERASQGMMRFAMTSGLGALRYGVTYRHAGKEFLNNPDQQVREVWGEWGFGVARFRTSVGDLLTNVERDPSRPSLSQTGGKLTVSVARPNWPELSLTYARNMVEHHPLQSGLTLARNLSEVVEGAVNIVRSKWTARFSSSYVLNSSQLQAGDDSVSYAQLFTGVFQPIEALTLTSVFSYRTDIQQWTGIRTETPVASLALNYRHSARLLISALGGYTGIRSSDGLTENETLNSKGVVTWSPWEKSAAQISLETGYSRTVVGGAGGDGNVLQDFSGLVRIRLTKF